MKLNKLKFLFFLSFILLLCFSFNLSVSADDVEKRGLEIKYPPINGIEITTSTTISEYAVYFFSLAMIIGTILAFAILIYGGFRYITSVGSPEAMSDAKKWIWESILGLMLLLSAWFVIGIINKGILSPSVPDVKALSGIYLVDKEGEKIPYSNSIANSIPEYFEVDHIEFISDKPEDISYANPDKDELCSVYIYNEKNLEGEAREEIKNTGAGTEHDVNNIGSMFLLWHDPGVYLYKEEGYDKEFNNPPRPKFIQTSQKSFKENFDNKIKSLRFVDDLSSKSSDLGYYYVVVFEEPNFNKNKGKCDIVFWDENSKDFSGSEIENNISSIAVFKIAEIHGEVKFYDEINQKGNKHTEKLTSQSMNSLFLSDTKSDETGEKMENWNSIAVNANATVVLCTDEQVVLGGYCRLFIPLGYGGDNLKTTSVYHKCYGDSASDCEEYLPKQALIISRQE
jgi:hypothetical protein